jgi:hypothetical protein
MGLAAGAIATMGVVATSSLAFASSSTVAACTATMSVAHPPDESTTDVEVATVPNAQVKTVAHYKSTSTSHNGTANGRGRATVPYRISRATAGYQVRVDVTVDAGGGTATCSTSFTPK